MSSTSSKGEVRPEEEVVERAPEAAEEVVEAPEAGGNEALRTGGTEEIGVSARRDGQIVLISPLPQMNGLGEEAAPSVMVRASAFSGSSSASKSQRRAARPSVKAKEPRKEGEPSSEVARLASTEPPTAPDRASVPLGSTVLIPVVNVEGEEEEAEPPLKRRRPVRVLEQPPVSVGAPKGKEQGAEQSGGRTVRLEKGKGRVRSSSVDKWEPAISLDKTATLGDFDVSLHIAENIIPPVDEEFMGRLDNQQLSVRLVRHCARGLAFARTMHSRVQERDALKTELLELSKVREELSGVTEERDLLRAQVSSLEEEKKLLENDKDFLKARFETGEEEKNRLMVARDELEDKFQAQVLANVELRDEVRAVNSKLMTERELQFELRQTCYEATQAKLRAINRAKELESRRKEERIAAIKRWKVRYLEEECHEYACDLILSTLQSCHSVHVPVGQDPPSFEEYAEPLVPPGLGLSLRELIEVVEGEPRCIPDEELDLNPEIEAESPRPSPHSDPSPTASSPPNQVATRSPPPDPSSGVMLVAEAALPTSPLASLAISSPDPASATAPAPEAVPPGSAANSSPPSEE